jgi:outer membrane protein assembly factor BamD
MWILPPSFEKDQSATSDAHRELSSFLKKYQRSPYLSKAKELLGRVNRRLAAHELYVARFYWKKGKPMATVLRLRRLLDKHSGVGFDPEALYLLGKAYVEVEEPGHARKAWERLVKEFPQDERAPEVRAELSRLRS